MNACLCLLTLSTRLTGKSIFGKLINGKGSSIPTNHFLINNKRKFHPGSVQMCDIQLHESVTFNVTRSLLYRSVLINLMLFN